MQPQRPGKRGDHTMTESLMFYIKLLLLTEALTHAFRSWEILASLRNPIKSRWHFADKLLNCFECSSVWGAALAISYLCFLDFWPLTALLIFSRWANVLHIIIDWLDALRASTINKI